MYSMGYTFQGKNLEALEGADLNPNLKADHPHGQQSKKLPKDEACPEYIATNHFKDFLMHNPDQLDLAELELWRQTN